MASLSCDEKKALKKIDLMLRKPLKVDMVVEVEELIGIWRSSSMSIPMLNGVVYGLTEFYAHQQALDVLQEALSIHGEIFDVLNLMGKVAIELQNYSSGGKIFARLIALNPRSYETYLNYAKCLREEGNVSDAIEVLKESIGYFPDAAALWNYLGIVVSEELNQGFQAVEFFNQAISLEPDNAKYIYNASKHYNRNELEALRSARLLDPENSQINLSIGLALFSMGKIAEAWPYYWYRRDPKLGPNKACAFVSHSYARWSGEEIAGKTIVVAAEQGIGDEVFFCLPLGKAVDIAAKVYVVCDPRLVSVIERSYPKVSAFSYVDEINFGFRFRTFPELDEHLHYSPVNVDYFCLMGDLMHHLYDTDEQYLNMQGFQFEVDLKLRDLCLGKISQKRDKPKIGFAWRSGNQKGERQHFYLQLDVFEKIFDSIDADFYVLQYSCSEDELVKLSYFENVHIVEDIDLKQDVEGCLALTSCMDLVLSPPTATQSFAQSVDVPVFLINGGKPWCMFGLEHMPKWYNSKSRWICTRGLNGDIETLVSKISEEVKSFFESHKNQ